MSEFLKKKLDPKYELKCAIADYDNLIKEKWLGNLSEAFANAWIDRVEAQAAYIQDIHQKHPWLIFERVVS